MSKDGLYISYFPSNLEKPFFHIYIENLGGSSSGDSSIESTFLHRDFCESNNLYLFDCGPYSRVAPLELTRWGNK